MQNIYDTPPTPSLIEAVRGVVAPVEESCVIVGLKNDMTRPTGNVKQTLQNYGAQYHSSSDKFTNFKVPAEHAANLMTRMKDKHNVYSSIISESTIVESTELCELSKNALSRYVDAAFTEKDAAWYKSHYGAKDERAGASKTYYKRKRGIRAALEKTTNEELEQVDELSKATLGRYIKAASTEQIPLVRLQDRQYKSARDYPADSDSTKYHADAGMKTGKKLINRVTGLHKATDKLTKESTKED